MQYTVLSLVLSSLAFLCLVYFLWILQTLVSQKISSQTEVELQRILTQERSETLKAELIENLTLMLQSKGPMEYQTLKASQTFLSQTEDSVSPSDEAEAKRIAARDGIEYLDSLDPLYYGEEDDDEPGNVGTLINPPNTFADFGR